MSKYHPKRLMKRIPGKARRTTALVLCAAMVASLVTFVLPTRADGSAGAGFRGLYTREADPNTMDSYIQASLGGYAGGTVTNNFGSRYAGEVWADLSVFALGQPDGSFGGSELKLDRYTDGLDSSVNIMSYSDFLNVFSLLGSSEASIDEEPIPLDVVFVLDTSASMSSAGEDSRYNTDDEVAAAGLQNSVAPGNHNVRLEFAADALNTAFGLLMENGSKYNRVALVTYDNTVRTVMDLGRYEPTVVDRNATNDRGEYIYSQGYHRNEERYFTIAQSSLVETAKNVPDTIGGAHVMPGVGENRVGFELGTKDTRTSNYFTFHWSKVEPVSTVWNRDANRYWNGELYQRYIIFGGPSSATNGRFIEFTTDGPATVTVLWTPDSDTAYSQIGIWQNRTTGSPRFFSDADYGNTKTKTYSYSVPSAGTYYIGNAQGSTRIYSVVVEETTPSKKIYNTTSRAFTELPIRYLESMNGVDTNGPAYVYKPIADYDGDPRFPQALLGYGSYYTLADTSGYAEDWKVVEVNARAETVNHAGETPTLYAGNVHSQADENVMDKNATRYNYFYTQSLTNTTEGLLTALRMLYAPDGMLAPSNSYTVKLYRGTDGKLTDIMPDNYEGETVELPRRPIVILISDGAPNPSKANYNWWELSTTTDAVATAPPVNAVPTITAAIGSYGRKQVNRAYFDNPDGTVWGDARLEAEIYTFGFMLNSQREEDDRQNSRATLDPGWLIDHQNDYTNTDTRYWDTLRYMREYLNSPGGLTIEANGRSYTMNHPTDPYDPKTLDDFRYVKQFTEVDNPTQLPDIFTEMIRSMLNDAFTPVKGQNATEVGDALTYSNPIGDYMVVDGVTDLTVFGEHYKVGRYAVYDYTANAAILKKEGKLSTAYIRNGWYDDNNTYYANLPAGVTADNAWDMGYTYRITYLDAQKLIPTLAETASNTDLTPKQRETVYTIYRITTQLPSTNTGDAWTVDSVVNETPVTEGNTTRRNFSYDLDFIANSGYSEDTMPEVTFDLWDDIRIWVEDTGSFNDDTGSSFVVEGGYDEALYVSVGNNALPMQVAAVTMQTTAEGRNPTVPTDYATNLTRYWASTPLRVYYSVSLDPDYLRYAYPEDYAAKGTYDEKQYAVGVAMADIDAGYSSSNTHYYQMQDDGFYDEVDPNTTGAERYTAFYTNYFTDSVYTGYPVATEAFDTSRGNPVVTFSVGTENQFYRFQKNRVLFLIPGSNGLTERPAEIDLGTLTDTHVAKDSNGKWYVAKDGSGEVLNPAEFEHLLAALNDAITGDDCIPVDGGTYMFGGQQLDQISPSNWYYIIREYYVPAEGSAAKVELRYRAIARKGSEFGSGLPGREDSIGEMVEWYEPASGHTEVFDSSNSDGHYGYPGKTSDSGNNHVHTGGWYASARPGGLRVGGMSNFVGTKGYEIRDDKTKDKSTVDKKNVTGTASTFFLPAVSSYVGEDSDVVILVYLGNNGRILVDQTLLLVTKRVLKFEDMYDTDDPTKFEYTISITGFSGTRKAVKVMWDDTNSIGKWRRTIGAINVHTNSDGLLYDSNNELAVVDGNYVYVPSSIGSVPASTGSRPVYIYDDDSQEIVLGGRNAVTGTLPGEPAQASRPLIEFTADTVYLVPTGSYRPGFQPVLGNPQQDFVIATMDPAVTELGEDTANVKLSSEYGINAEYVTVPIEFDSQGNAAFRLQSGEGLLFNTIDNDAHFSVTEHLIYSDDGEEVDLAEKGWTFVSINDVKASVSKAGDGFSYDYSNADDTYTVEGDMMDAVSGEVTAHFINQKLTGLTVRKLLDKADGATLNEQDYGRPFDFKIEISTSGSRDFFNYALYNVDNSIKEQGHLATASHNETTADHPANNSKWVEKRSIADGTWTFSLMPGEYINIDVPDGADYKVTETPKVTGFVPEAVEEPGENDPRNPDDGNVYVQEGTIPDVEASVVATFTNVKQPPKPVPVGLKVSKTVTGDDAPALDAGQYSFIIMPAEGNPEGDPITEKIRVTIADEHIKSDAFAEIVLFSDVEYTRAGIYIYLVYEEFPKADAIPGISYDGTVYTVVVRITEDDTSIDDNYFGELKASVEATVDGSAADTAADNNGLIIVGQFENTYDKDSVDVTFSGIKTLQGGQLAGGDFEFELAGKEGTEPPVPEVTRVTNNAGGMFQFGPIRFESSGTYYYTIREVPGSGTGITYDSTVYEVTVTVVEQDGALKASWTFTPDNPERGMPEFVNFKGIGKLIISKTVSGSGATDEDFEKEFTFKVTLTPPDGETLAERYDYTVGGSTMTMILDDENAGTITLTHGQTAVFEGLPAGTGYAVEEVLGADDGEFTPECEDNDGSISEGVDAAVEFINKKGDDEEDDEPGAGRLSITKTVTGNGATDEDFEKEFTFKVTLTPPEGGTLAERYDYTVGGITRTMELDSDNVGTITLTHGQTAVFEGLPAGTGYVVEEVLGADDGEFTPECEDNDGSISEGVDAAVEFINKKGDEEEDDEPGAGRLSITKTVTGNGATDEDFEKEFTFKVTLTPPEGGTLAERYDYTGDKTGTLDLTQNDDGTYSGTITLSHGQSVTIRGLPAGTGYKVTEDEADGFSTSATDATGAISKDTEAKAAFTNTRDKEEEEIRPATGSLTVSKTVSGSGGDTEQEFTFTVTLNSSITGTYGGMAFRSGVATFTLRHGESKTATGLPAGVTYTVTEAEANRNGYATTASGGTGTITGGGTARANFTNTRNEEEIRPATGSLTVSKTVSGSGGDTEQEFTFTVTLNSSITGTYGGMAFRGGVATFTLKHGESKTATGLPAGVTYTVTEAEADQDGYETTASGDTGTIPEDGVAVAGFTNAKEEEEVEPETGSLTVSKTVSGNAGDTEQEFTFTVTLDDTGINGTYGDMTFTDGVASFTLKHGESKTAAGLPADATYTVTEAEANQDGYETTASGDTGTIPDGGAAEASFTNAKEEEEVEPETGSLTVSKTVAGNSGERYKEFHFTVTLSDSGINGTYGDMTFVNGVADITLRDGKSKTAEGLPAGITYTVTEAEANQDGYVTAAGGDTGTIPEGTAAVAGFTNTRDVVIDPGTGNLTVGKTVGGSTGDRTGEFTFAVVLSDNTVNGTYGGMTFVNGVASFTLRHGESRTATGLPAGITYSVMEAEANQDGYITASKNRDGTVPDQGAVQATFYNTRGELLPDDPLLEEFDDPEIPLSGFPNFPNPPQTGDNSHPALWFTLMIVSAVGLVLTVFFTDGKRKLFSAKSGHTKK